MQDQACRTRPYTPHAQSEKLKPAEKQPKMRCAIVLGILIVLVVKNSASLLTQTHASTRLTSQTAAARERGGEGRVGEGGVGQTGAWWWVAVRKKSSAGFPSQNLGKYYTAVQTKQFIDVLPKERM